jgi:putative flippase GtrA
VSRKREFLSFVLIGGFAAAVNFVARFPIDRFTSFEVAIVLAYIIAMTTAFLLNRRFVFMASDGPIAQQYWRFVLVNLLALAQVFAVSVGLARLLFPAMGFTWQADAIAHAIGLASPILTSYWAHKHFSFAPAGGAGAAAKPR